MYNIEEDGTAEPTTSVNEDAEKSPAEDADMSESADTSEEPATGDGKQKKQQEKKPKYYVLFVGNLPYSATVEEIRSHFQQIGIYSYTLPACTPRLFTECTLCVYASALQKISLAKNAKDPNFILAFCE